MVNKFRLFLYLCLEKKKNYYFCTAKKNRVLQIDFFYLWCLVFAKHVAYGFVASLMHRRKHVL